MTYEKRRVRHEYERDFSILEEKIRFVLATPHQTDIASITALPQPARSIAEILSEAPIDKMMKNLSDKKKILGFFQEFLKARSQLSPIAIHLQQAVRGYIRQAAYAAKLPVTEDAKYESFYLARILQFQNKAIMDWTGITPEMLPGLEKLLEFILADTGVVQLDLEYVKARGELELALDKVRTEFGYEPLQLKESPYGFMPKATYLTNSVLK